MENVAEETDAAAAAADAGADADSEEAGSSASDSDSDPEQEENDDDDDDDDETHSNATEDFEFAHSVEVVVSGFRDAVTLLEDPDDRSPIGELTVRPPARPDRHQDQFFFFRRFGELLRQREGGRHVGGIGLHMGWDGLRDEDMELLFRDVLPGHRTVKRISMDIDGLPPRFVRMLTESIPAATANASAAWRLYLQGVGSNPDIKAQTVQAIVGMLNRNAAIEELSFMLRLDPHQCQLICSAVSRNSVIRVLSLNVTEMVAGTLDGVAASSSSLRRLAVHGRLTEDGISSLARQLRTNETLEFLLLFNLVDRGTRTFPALLELVRTYNYTVSDITIHANNEMTALLARYQNRNQMIRRRVENLKDPDPEQRLVAPTQQLMAQFLCLTSGMPTVVYRIMKHWYVHYYQASARLSRPRSQKRKAAATAADDAAAVNGDSSQNN